MNLSAAALVAWSRLSMWSDGHHNHNRRCATLNLPLPVVCHPHHKHHPPVPVMAARRGGDGNDGRAAKLKMRDAKLVEKLLLDAVRKLSREEGDLPPSKLFPSVRQCNSALAAFGDAGEFRRALRLFVQMKKSATLAGTMDASSSSIHAFDSTLSEGGSSRISSIELVLAPPKPTLVTYSTLMSRAVSLGKPRVALRLWNLMRNQPNFYTNVISRRRRDKRIATKRVDTTELRRLEMEDDAVIIPDVVFCNVLMNVYAKLGDHVSARSILNAMLGVNGVCHEGIPLTGPTVVTYNTLADACKGAGELGSALETLELMIHHADETGDRSCLPDVQTYTTLISTVGRKKKNEKEARDVRSGGENDPDMAFALLNRMLNEGITPNGVTYSALIDVCGRCRRTDMALNGLRTMLKQKSKESLASRRRNVPIYHQQSLYNEVGAWTAAINACGKGGRVDTAIRLFRTMQSVGVKPNSVTCGCLADCLLKASPVRMAETLEVLGYMQKACIAPGEVMYTSLMSVALSLAQKETEGMVRRDGLELQIIDRFDRRIDTEDASSSESIVLYSELMRLMVADGNDTNSLLKVFLAFQALQNAGASPDTACYNSLLRACALSGDVAKAQDVLQRMNEEGVEPNRRSWREALKAARKAKKAGSADDIWARAIAPQKKDFAPLIPQASDVELLLSVYTSELRRTSNHEVRSLLNSKIMRLYEGIVDQSEGMGFHHGSVSVDEIESNQAFMLSVLRAAVSHEFHCQNDEERSHARELACEIAGLEVFQQRLSSDVDRNSKKALQVAQDWLYSY
ncbi:hypothetical protein ACHAXT_005420 [Thalassiosira profunda]